MGETSPESAFSQVLIDAIKGKKPSKWFIQLLLLLGISIILEQLISSIIDITSNIFYLVIIGLSIPFLIASYYLKDHFEHIIERIISESLDQDFTESLNFFTEVMGKNKNILDSIKLKDEVYNILLLGFFNLMFLSLILLFADVTINNFIGDNLFTKANYLGGILLIIIAFITNIYFNFNPIKDNPEIKNISNESLVPIFLNKIYDNLEISTNNKLKIIGSFISLFFFIPHLDIKKRKFWLGLYLCTPEIKNYIIDFIKENDKNTNCIINSPSTNLDDFFDCNKISGLENLLDFQLLLPLQSLSRLKGDVDKNHPAISKGITIKLFHAFKLINRTEYKQLNLTIHILPWKGCVYKKELISETKIHQVIFSHDKGVKTINPSYKVEITPEDRRVLSFYIIGEADAVENIKFQLSLKAPEAKEENIFLK